ncbi:hypothetical protein E2C01_032339 [Portunus trituberculatus]|uniref:Uncharacterized protein n=1 Tax=Portunus trituberculatus TaxID=210409 RepID=A0A5B7F137_PORTR|nr:hypothetical protein [Portunus trituberculatus]
MWRSWLTGSFRSRQPVADEGPQCRVLQQTFRLRYCSCLGNLKFGECAVAGLCQRRILFFFHTRFGDSGQYSEALLRLTSSTTTS